jgi:hypothetical protein
VNEKEVLDENYRKAGKMDLERFASQLDPAQTDLMKIIHGHLLEGTQSRNHILAKLHKLNVYSMHVIFIFRQQLTRCPGKGSFFKPHVDTPRGEKMFGSLVVVFPTPHEGGALFLRHRGQEWVFDSGRELKASHRPSIGYVMFFSDVEHEVAPVISGHRVTLTYNLYFDEDRPEEHLSHPPAVNESTFRRSFQGLLENPEFLASGGTLAFGLRHVYPINDRGNDGDEEDEENFQVSPLKPLYGALKGSDAVVYETFRALGFQPVLYMYYEWMTPNGLFEGAVIDKVLEFDYLNQSGSRIDITMAVREEGGIVVRQENWETDYSSHVNPEKVVWVTPRTTINRKQGVYATYGNDPQVEFVYADLCLFVRIGKAGERLVYPSGSQLRKEWEEERGKEGFYDRWAD